MNGLMKRNLKVRSKRNWVFLWYSVVRTVHELLQGAPRPVRALVAGRQLLRRGGPSIAHVQRGFPRGPPLHVPPLAEVARHGVPQESD
ncbi:unnamed protein product, partial [Menidia menidia]